MVDLEQPMNMKTRERLYSSLSDYEKHSIWSGSGKSSATKSSREETIEMEESDVKKVAKSTVVSSAKKTNRADKGKQQSASTRVCIRHAATVMKVKDFPKCEAPKCQCDHSSPSSNADYHGLMTAVRMTSMSQDLQQRFIAACVETGSYEVAGRQRGRNSDLGSPT